MSQRASVRIQDHFSTLTDPRRRKVRYPLINVVTIALCGVLCGADDFVSIAAWARMKKDGLSKFLDLSAGIPSHDRFNAIFAALRPAEFEKCLLSWITTLHEITGGPSPHAGTSRDRREEQRDHGDSETAGNAGDFRLFGDD